MLTAYYQLLSLTDDYSTITVTMSAIGDFFHIYRNGNKIRIVEYGADDIARIKKHYWGDLHPMTPHLPIERFIRVLAPDTLN